MRSEYKQPETPDELPPPDAMIVALATCNTLGKWAAGISDTLPLGSGRRGRGQGPTRRRDAVQQLRPAQPSGRARGNQETQPVGSSRSSRRRGLPPARARKRLRVHAPLSVEPSIESD